MEEAIRLRLHAARHRGPRPPGSRRGPEADDRRLVGFRPDYEKCCPKTASTIARRIVEHCLEYFAMDACPRIVLNDPDDEARIDLKRFYAEEMRVRSETRKFTIKGKEFRANHVLVNSGADGQHRIFFCAHNRAVRSEALANKVPDLVSPLKDPGSGTSIVYSGYVSGMYLDETVNAERTAFHVLDQLELDLPGELSWQDLVQGMVAQAGEFLSPYTEPIKKSKQDRIREYVHTQAPQYRPVIKHRSEWLDEIPASLPDDKLDVELYKIDQRYGAELREEALQTPGHQREAEGGRGPQGRLREVHGGMERARDGEAGQVRRPPQGDAGVPRRPAQATEDGRYPLEESVHQIIFPLRQTSDDIRSDRMNLWIIDEKLAYHNYLASDKLFKQLEPVEIDSKNRPDLLIFNHPFAFADSEPPFGSIVLVEFKRRPGTTTPTRRTRSPRSTATCGRSRRGRPRTVRAPDPGAPFDTVLRLHRLRPDAEADDAGRERPVDADPRLARVRRIQLEFGDLRRDPLLRQAGGRCEEAERRVVRETGAEVVTGVAALLALIR